jgi:hypothetical protein
MRWAVHATGQRGRTRRAPRSKSRQRQPQTAHARGSTAVTQRPAADARWLRQLPAQASAARATGSLSRQIQPRSAHATGSKSRQILRRLVHAIGSKSRPMQRRAHATESKPRPMRRRPAHATGSKQQQTQPHAPHAAPSRRGSTPPTGHWRLSRRLSMPRIAHPARSRDAAAKKDQPCAVTGPMAAPAQGGERPLSRTPAAFFPTHPCSVPIPFRKGRAGVEVRCRTLTEDRRRTPTRIR